MFKQHVPLQIPSVYRHSIRFQVQGTCCCTKKTKYKTKYKTYAFGRQKVPFWKVKGLLLEGERAAFSTLSSCRPHESGSRVQDGSSYTDSSDECRTAGQWSTCYRQL